MCIILQFTCNKPMGTTFFVIALFSFIDLTTESTVSDPSIRYHSHTPFCLYSYSPYSLLPRCHHMTHIT